MTPSELNQILGDQVPKEPLSFESNEEHIKSIDTTQQMDSNIPEVSDTQIKKYRCKYCGMEGFESLVKLMGHSRHCKMRPPTVKKPKEEVSIDTNESDKNMIDDETSLEVIPETSPIEVEEAKGKKKRTPVEPATPTIYDRLRKLLTGYKIDKAPGIMQSCEMHDISSPLFLPVLKDILRNAGTQPNIINAIMESWGQMIGVKVDNNESSKIGDRTSSQPQSFDVLDNTLKQLQLDEVRRLQLDSARTAQEERDLNNEIKRKRLTGEYMDPKTTDSDRLRIELEMMKMQMMQPKTDPVLEMLKTELQMLRNQPKADPQLEMLKAELVRIQSQLSTNPQKDSQVEALRLQIESQNKRNEELQRKIEEDARETRIREEARRDREIFEKQIQELAKQNQEMLKLVQTSNAPKTEDILVNKIAEMQRAYNEQITQLKSEFLNTRREEQYKIELERLKEEQRINKENSEGQLGQVASSMKDFATNMTHAFEKTMLEKDFQRKEDDLKKKISDIEHNRSMTNEQYVMEKTTKLAEEAVKAVGGALDGFGKALQPATQKAAESSSIMEKAALAMDLKRQGLSEQTINTVLNQQTSRPVLPSAKQEYENLSRMTEQIQMNNPQPQPIQTPQVSNIMPNEPMSELPIEPIRFATGDKE